MGEAIYMETNLRKCEMWNLVLTTHKKKALKTIPTLSKLCRPIDSQWVLIRNRRLYSRSHHKAPKRLETLMATFMVEEPSYSSSIPHQQSMGCHNFNQARIAFRLGRDQMSIKLGVKFNWAGTNSAMAHVPLQNAKVWRVEGLNKTIGNSKL